MNDGTADRVNFYLRENESKIKIVVVENGIHDGTLVDLY